MSVRRWRNTVLSRLEHSVYATWQQIFHLECDLKPRRRTIMVTADGE